MITRAKHRLIERLNRLYDTTIQLHDRNLIIDCHSLTVVLPAAIDHDFSGNIGHNDLAQAVKALPQDGSITAADLQAMAYPYAGLDLTRYNRTKNPNPVETNTAWSINAPELLPIASDLMSNGSARARWIVTENNGNHWLTGQNRLGASAHLSINTVRLWRKP